MAASNTWLIKSRRCPFYINETKLSMIWRTFRHLFHVMLCKSYWRWKTFISRNVQIILVLKMTNISSKWRYFRPRLSLIFEHNDTHSVSAYDITVTSYERHCVWTHRHLDCLFNSLLSLTTEQISKSRITGGFTYKPDDIRCNPISSEWHDEIWTLYHPNAVPGSISSRWLMANGICHPDDLGCPLKSSRWHNEI